MKVWVSDNQIILSGKAWEVKAKLKEYGNHYLYVKDWIQAVRQIK